MSTNCQVINSIKLIFSINFVIANLSSRTFFFLESSSTTLYTQFSVYVHYLSLFAPKMMPCGNFAKNRISDTWRNIIGEINNMQFLLRGQLRPIIK